MFTSYTLKNNARVILIPQEDTHSATTLVMYPVGSRYEPEKLAGVSHYIEHLMFKGTKKRKNTLILTREIDHLGAEYNAFTGKEYTGYYIKSDAQYLETSLDILSDMLFSSLFDPKEMEREKGPVIEEIRMYNDNPLMNIENVFEDLLYAGCPLGRDIAGTETHVKSYRREDVLAYKEKYYVPRNMTVVIAGNIPGNITTLIDAYFAKEQSARRPSAAFRHFQYGPGEKIQRIRLQKKQTDQTQLMIGFPGFAHAAKENDTLFVLNAIFGASMSSRLFIQIRERRGLAYMIRSGSEAFHDTGYQYIRAGLESKNINKALSVIAQEIKKMVERPVTDRELRDAKTHIRGSVTLSLEDSSAQANWYARRALFYPMVETPEDVLKKIDRVTKEQIQALAKRIFRMHEMRIAIIGDVKKETITF